MTKTSGQVSASKKPEIREQGSRATGERFGVEGSEAKR